MLLGPPQRERKVWRRLPDRPCWATFLWYSFWLTIEWVVVYGGANWIAGLHSYRVRLNLDFERQIPFMPESAVVYLSLFPMLWISPFVLRSPKRLRPFAVALAWLIALSGLGFLLLPSKQVGSLPKVTGVNGAVIRFADLINLTYNYLPSLHVGMAVVCAYAYSRRSPQKLAVFFWLWAAAIALSTLLTYQHYVADVITGAALGLLVATMLAT
jgi:membrane-associated phospholipid phosphatase